MWKWAQGAVASVAGTAEPEYGAQAFMAVDKTVSGRNPYGEVTRADLEWKQPAQSHVETQTFYFYDEASGYFGFVQLIHSNPVNVSFTTQFTSLVASTKDPNFQKWTSVNLNNSKIEDANLSADGGFEIKLAPGEALYTFKSGSVSDIIQADLQFKLVDRGFKIGADGTSRYGTDLSQPWGTMTHVFWPRAELSGEIRIEGASVPLSKSQGMYVKALQGMKPHHAARRWNFLNFQGPTVAMVAMEFETPSSYGNSRSSIGAVVKDGKLVATGVNVGVEHQDVKVDEVGWPAPSAISFVLEGPAPEAKKPEATVKATVQGALKRLVARMDVMAELPAFVKRVASGISGTNPFIYVYHNPMTIKVEIDGKVFEEEGVCYNEATFIS